MLKKIPIKESSKKIAKIKISKSNKIKKSKSNLKKGKKNKKW